MTQGVLVLFITCSSWLWFSLPYSESRKRTHRCLTFLRDSGRLRPKDLANPIKGKPQYLFLKDLFWPQRCGCFMPDTKLVCYSKPRLNRHYYQHAKMHGSIEKQANRGWAWCSLLFYAFIEDMTSTRGHTRSRSSAPHQTSASLRPSLLVKLHFTARNHYDPGNTGTKRALGHVNTVHITNKISHSSTEQCIALFKTHILQTNKVSEKLNQNKSQSVSLGLPSNCIQVRLLFYS